MAIKHLKIFHFVKENKDPIYCLKNNECKHFSLTFRHLKVHMKSCVDNKSHEAIEIQPVQEDIEDVLNDNPSLVDVIILNIIFLILVYNKIFVFNLKVNSSSTDIRDLSFFVPQIGVPDISNLSNQFEASTFIYDCPDKSKSSIAVKNMEEFISLVHTSISSMNLTHEDTSRVYNLMLEMTRETRKFYVNLLDDNQTSSVPHVLNQSSDIILKELNKRSKKYRRNQNINASEFYVEPKEMAFGLRWEQRKVIRGGRKVFVPRLIQSTFQYVSIVETLTALFRYNEFRDRYFQFNARNNHDCRPENFSDFCCGSTFKATFFIVNRNCIKIQLYSDEFEVCNPLQSNADVHKVLGVYFSIRNMPLEFQSKLRRLIPQSRWKCWIGVRSQFLCCVLLLVLFIIQK